MSPNVVVLKRQQLTELSELRNLKTEVKSSILSSTLQVVFLYWTIFFRHISGWDVTAKLLVSFSFWFSKSPHHIYIHWVLRNDCWMPNISEALFFSLEVFEDGAMGDWFGLVVRAFSQAWKEKTTLLLCPHRTKTEEESKLCGVSSYNGTNPSMGTPALLPHLNLITSQWPQLHIQSQ